MAATLQLPTKVIRTKHHSRRTTLDYEPYNNETEYISPSQVQNVDIAALKRKVIRLTGGMVFSKNDVIAAKARV